MYFANYSKTKNMSMSAGKVCIKRFEFACMAILSPETNCIDSYMPMFNYGYASAACSISAQKGLNTDLKCIKNAHRGNHKVKIFSGETPRTPLTRGATPLVLSPSLVSSALALTSAGPLLTAWRRACSFFLSPFTS